MSQEEEFSKWLRRKEKSFEDNLKFAIKSWQSVEFTLATKYEVILQWIIEQKYLKDHQILEEDFCELLKLRAQPGLIAQNVKRDFVEWFLKQAHEAEVATRKWCNLLQLLTEFEILQDLYHMDYKLQCHVYGKIFNIYEKYLLTFELSSEHFLSTFESEFFASILKSLKETIKRCGDLASYETAFTSHALQPLSQVLLLLRTFKVDFFEDFLEIESLVSAELTDYRLINRILNLSLPVRLLCLECAIDKRRGIGSFLKSLLVDIFSKLMQNSSGEVDPSLSLTVAAYVLEMLCRHDVSLNIQIHENLPAVKFLGIQVFTVVKMYKDEHLKEVLMLLCATLRLNPLILEQNVFQITAWMILAPKRIDKEEQELFEEYLVLLMDMFRRLSRAEKFVTNLLKALNEHVNLINLSGRKKRKAEIDLEEKPAKKKINMEGEEKPKAKYEDVSNYLNILFKDFFKPILSKSFNDNVKLSATMSFPKLQSYWPSNPVGLSFSKIIVGLVSKPSLTIWKSLLYALKELIETLQNQDEISENALFQLDFHSALLSQYFAGCKLAEQSDKFLVELQQQREFTSDVFKLYGKFLLKKEHQPRIMTAFLELTYFATNFELLLVYYRPDGCNHVSLQPNRVVEQLYNFLTPEEWILIQQRVLNFGKSSCKHLLHRLMLQKYQASLLLLSPTKNDFSLKSDDPDTLSYLLKTPQAKWYLQKLQRNEKVTIAPYFISKPELLTLVFDDLELLEFVSLAIYENFYKLFNCKYSLLKTLACDFDKIRQCVEIAACELLIKELFDKITSHSQQEYKVKKLSAEDIKISLDILSQLPIGQLRRQRKTIIFALHLCLYRDLKAAKEDDLALKSLDIMKDLLHFGQQIFIFKYLPISILLHFLPPESCWELYEFLFSTVKNQEKGTEKFLEDLAAILVDAQTLSSITDEQCKLLLAAIDTLSTLTGPSAKHMRKHLVSFLKIFSKYLKNYFSSFSDGTSKKDKKFVQKTLSGFATYTSTILTKAAKVREVTSKQTKEMAENNQSKDNEIDSKLWKQANEVDDGIEEIDEDFRRISKIYIGYSMDYRNPYAIRLMQVSLNHRQLLHLDQDEIEFVLTNYWSQIKEDLNGNSCQNGEEQENLYPKTIESAVKMIISNKTNEDLLLILKTIGGNMEGTTLSNILRLLKLIAKCPFSTIKGAIFNEEYKQITFNITMCLAKDEQQVFNDYYLVVNLLNCHQAVLDNKMIPISTDTMDSILSFLVDINIKRFRFNDTNLNVFNNLHKSMTELCSSLIKYRHVLLMDRVPQYMHIFKDLLQAIVWYKSERQKDIALPSDEIDSLSELAFKLEALMHLIAQHKVVFKRVAPFVLTFLINLMVANKRPTTLYNKIKTHIENICYELVGICDHRAGRFILRSSNEAGRQLYEILVKDYQKYHKFKGKM